MFRMENGQRRREEEGGGKWLFRLRRAEADGCMCVVWVWVCAGEGGDREEMVNRGTWDGVGGQASSRAGLSRLSG